MPGYRSLSSHISGDAAEHARAAEVQQRGGDSNAAARLLEEALDACARVRPELPGWVCGRLASIYRTLKRYDDEVVLLERYRDSQSSEEARNRFDARLSKARAIADRKRRSDTGALATVREVRDRSSQRRRPPHSVAVVTERSVPQFVHDDVDEMRSALADVTLDGPERLHAVMVRLCADARTMDEPMESLVSLLKECWVATPMPASLDDEGWHERYASAMVELLAIYFGESA
ncbi:MAG: hypothetical protein ABI601_12720 [bacterium]